MCGDALFAFGEACCKFGQVFTESRVLPVGGHTAQAVNDMAVDDRHNDSDQDQPFLRHVRVLLGRRP